MPATRQTFVDPLLTNVSVAYKNTSFVADRLFPTVNVQKETGIYFVKDKENLRAPADAERGEFDRANRVTNTLSQATYTLSERSLESPISDRVMQNYDDPFDPMRNATELVTEKLLIDNEKDARDALIASTTPTDVAGAWATSSTDIKGAIRNQAQTILRNTGQRPNTIMISEDAMNNAFLKNDALIDAIKYTRAASNQELFNSVGAFLGVPNVVVGSAIENTAAEGQTDSLGFIWDDYVILAYVAPTAALETPTTGYKLAKEGGLQVDRWYEQEIKTTFVRASHYFDNKVIDSSAYHVFQDVVTT